MNFYVTGRSSRIPEVERAFEAIEARGHRVTFRWTSFPMAKPYDEHPDLARDYSKSSIQGIIDADVYILFAHTDGNGVFTEFGAALALLQAHGRPTIYVIGEESLRSSAMFHYHPAVQWRSNLEQVLSEVA